MQISVSAKVTTADMNWLEQQFETKGFTQHIDSIAVHCHVADFQSAFPLVSTCRYHPENCTKHAGRWQACWPQSSILIWAEDIVPPQ